MKSTMPRYDLTRHCVGRREATHGHHRFRSHRFRESHIGLESSLLGEARSPHFVGIVADVEVLCESKDRLARNRRRPRSMTDAKPVGRAQDSLPLLVALCFSAGGLYGWSAMIPALKAAFGITTELAGLVFSIAIVVFSAAVYTVPRLPDAYRGARVGAIFGITGSVSLGVAAMAGNFVTFLLAFALGFAAASGAIYILGVEVAGRSRRPSLATPIMITAFGLGGAVFGPGLRYLVGYGWGLKALYLLVFALASTSVVALFLAPPYRQNPTSPEPRPATMPARPTGPTTSTMVLLFCAFATGSVAGLMTLGLATSIVESYGGGVWLSGAALFGIAIGNTGGRLSVGLLSERASPGVIVMSAPLVSAIGIIVAGSIQTPAGVALGLVIVATGCGLIASGLPTLTRAFCGAEDFGRAFSIVFIAWGVAGFVSPWVSGRLFDLYGDFQAAFVLAFAASLMSFGFAWLLQRWLAAAWASSTTRRDIT
jgi:OFA family oxalate/formate antiporter-like MFS transporter